MASKWGGKNRKTLALMGGGGLVVVAVIVVVLVLVLGRGPGTSPAEAATPHEAAQNFERALLAADIDALMEFTHPDERQEIRESWDEVRAEIGDAEFREGFRSFGRAFTDRQLTHEAEDELRFEFDFDGFTETVTFRRSDGHWWVD